MMKKLNDMKNRQRVWILTYVVLAAVLVMLAWKVLGQTKTITAWFQGLFHTAAAFMVPLTAGIVVAYILLPVVKRIQKVFLRFSFFQKRQNPARTLAVLLTVVLAILAIFLLLILIIGTITSEFSKVDFSQWDSLISALTQALNGQTEEFNNWVDSLNLPWNDLNNWIKDLGSNLGGILSSLTGSIVGSVSSITGFLSTAFFSLMFGVYFMLGTDGITAYWDGILRRLFGKKVYHLTHVFLGDADKAFSGYIRGQLLDACLMVFLVGVPLSILGVKFAFLIGVLTGIGNLIPYVGPIVAYISTALVCIANGEIKKLIIALILLLIVQFVDGNIINPRLLSSNVEVHPLLVISALLAGGNIGGIVGMLVAVPCASLLKTLFERFVDMVDRHREKRLEGEKTSHLTEDGASSEKTGE